VKNLVSRILGERCHNQIRAICADITEVKQRIRRVRSNRKMNKVFFLHDNVRPHTREAIATMGWTVLSHPPYSPDLAPPDFHIFGPLKDALRGRRFTEDDELKHSVREELRRFSKEFFATGMQLLKQRRNSVLIMKKTLWKNNLSFVNYVPLIYVSLIIIVIIVSEKK
jgi:hypothetical protein